MDRDRVNEVLYNRPYDSLYNRCFGWLGLWAEWKHVLEYGADALRCTDGQILNGIRNRMVYWLSELAISEYTMDDVREEAQMNGIDLDDMMMELPPVMDENYMKDAESIMECPRIIIMLRIRCRCLLIWKIKRCLKGLRRKQRLSGG